MCACIGGVAVAARPNSNPFNFTSVAEAAPVETSESLRESYDRRWDDFSNQLAAAKPGGDPISGTFSNGEVSSKLTSILKEGFTQDTGMTLKGAFVDFRDDLALLTIKFGVDKQAIELRSSFTLTPVGKKIQIKPKQVLLYGFTPFPLPITDIVTAALAQESTPLEIDFPKEIQKIEMRDGRLVITAKP